MTTAHATQAIAALAKRCERFAAEADRHTHHITVPFSELITALQYVEAARSALFLAAPHHQGGHSLVGAAIAEVLDVPHAISWRDLLDKLRAEGKNPALLYPGLVHMSPKLFTATEVAEIAATARKIVGL